MPAKSKVLASCTRYKQITRELRYVHTYVSRYEEIARELRYSPTTTSHSHALLRVSTRAYTQRASVFHITKARLPRQPTVHIRSSRVDVPHLHACMGIQYTSTYVFRNIELTTLW